MTIEKRLEKLERKIEAMQTVIRTKELCVLDDQGKERIKLVVTEDWEGNGGPELVMLDEHGKRRAGMSVHKDGSSELVMNDETGIERAGMSVNTFGWPELLTKDKNGKTNWKAP